MNRTDRKNDRRSGVVAVGPYEKADGTRVRDHTRRRPVMKGKLKFRVSDRDVRVKGKVVAYGPDGRAIDSQRINVSEQLSAEERAEIRRLQGEMR
jgi:hypothetical protein